MFSVSRLLPFSPVTDNSRFSSPFAPVETFFPGTWPSGKGLNFTFRLQCSTVSQTRTQEHKDQGVVPAFIDWPDVLKEDIEKRATQQLVLKHVESIRELVSRMDDGEISISPYDTAWVAMVEDVNGSGEPQFPSSLEWISKNQLPDGSWGDRDIFLAHDRIINTLACIIALKSWNTHPDKSEKGLSFIRDNIYKLGDENMEHMPIGFEVAFPSLIDIAKKLGIEIPEDSSPILLEIYEQRDLKLRRIPKEILQTVPTTLLHSLEGMKGLNWESLLKLKCADGSFLFSPSSTAFALMNTKDQDCLRYLTKTVEKFNGGVPNVYPVDLFEHIWVVDRLQRLGISRYLETEIKECVNYVKRYWTDKGICWARNTHVQDVDDTAMGFRILRMYGHDVSPDVFRQFRKGDEFHCFAGQSNQAVTGIYNLYRASEIMFPDEEILAAAKKFSSNFLQEKRANNELLDKWIITKDLAGEVGYALDVPWYASLPRIETRYYLEHYGGQDDVWIGKTLYRMSNVNNNLYLELGKLDYNYCQRIHQQEWKHIQKWYMERGLRELGLNEGDLLLSYYLAAASIFEPERSEERLAWAKTAVLMETIKSNFSGSHEFRREHKTAFIREVMQDGRCPTYENGEERHKLTHLLWALLGTINQFTLDALVVDGRDIHQNLRRAWGKWLESTLEEEENGINNNREAELIVHTINLCRSGSGSGDGYVHEEEEEKLVSHPKYKKLMDITCKICSQIREFQIKSAENSKYWTNMAGTSSIVSINLDMQKLVKLVYSNSSSSEEEEIDNVKIKQTFLVVAKSYYYAAYCNPGTINFHVAKVLFDEVF